jgi:hypothetical protein
MMMAMAATQRTEVTLAAYADHMYQDVQVRALGGRGLGRLGWGLGFRV